MKRLLASAPAVLAALLLTAEAPAQAGAAPVAVLAQLAAGPELPAQGAFPEDPADSLYRAAREALNRGDFKRAAQLFHQIPVSYARSAYVPDALYWEAFALYRVGGESALEQALARLEEQAERHPRASTRREAGVLTTRIRGVLARQGNTREAERIAREAQRAARAPAPAPARQQGCASEDDDIRATALNALLQMDAEQAVPMLKQVLARRDACAGPLRQKAVFLLSQKPTSETETLLLSIARGDPDPEVREQAVFWLSQVPGERSLDVLQQIVRGDGDEGIREKAIFALSQHSSPRSATLLRELAEQDAVPDALREQAIFWLSQKGSPETASYLRALYGRLDTPALREKVIFSLSQMPGAENERWLMDLAMNERQPEELREKALFWAAQSPSVSTSELSALYDRVPSGKLRGQVLFGLSQRNDPAAVTKLIAIARGDGDRELRKQALFWLGQSDDPRAAQAILDILNQP